MIFLHLHVHLQCTCTCTRVSLSPSLSIPPALYVYTYHIEFPLTSLNLMDYCYVSDVGVANIVSMTTLTELTLSKTKLTDIGMHCVAGNTHVMPLEIGHLTNQDTSLIRTPY